MVSHVVIVHLMDMDLLLFADVVFRQMEHFFVSSFFFFAGYQLKCFSAHYLFNFFLMAQRIPVFGEFFEPSGTIGNGILMVMLPLVWSAIAQKDCTKKCPFN